MLKGKGNSSFDEMMKRMWQGVSPWGPLEKGCLIEMQASAFWLLKNVGPTLTFYAYNLLFQVNAEYLQLIIEKERNYLYSLRPYLQGENKHQSSLLWLSHLGLQERESQSCQHLWRRHLQTLTSILKSSQL